INTMVDQLSGFADEVTRVAREVGTEGTLGGQARVPNVAGTWKDLTDSVNFMASNLTAQVRNIAQVATAVAQGDLSQQITVDVKGEMLELKNTLNTMVDQLSGFADEVTRMARDVGTEGRLGGQARVPGVAGTWRDLTDSVNFMAGNLTAQVRNIAQVTTAVAQGDLSQKITVDARGEILELKTTINTMVDQLSGFADEVTRVAREVGTEGILGGQARVPNVAGTWKDLTDNVNFMANNLTNQVRNIAQVTTAVALGDLSKKIDVDARGEILELKTTINTMVDQLSSFASEVTRVAREVGTKGILGGQAEVEDVSGTWRRLTESVNQLAGNLTTQVRAIADVATAVTAGDLNRQITVDAPGEVGELKDNINQMIATLLDTTRANEEQNWLKSHLARISGLLQGHRDLHAMARLIMSELTPLVTAQHGVFFLTDSPEGPATAGTAGPWLDLIAGYGYQGREGGPRRFAFGESLVGQAAVEKKTILLTDAPPDYIRISSGLGSSQPVNVIVLPVLFEDRVLGVIELASVNRFTDVHRDFLEQLKDTIGVSINTIMTNSRTDALLAESQRLTDELRVRSAELQVRQEELQQSNTELEEKAAQLARQNRDIELKNAEIEQARHALEERAQQLALASKVKSEFLANMSHELRTPLNSLLILARLLSDNADGNLTTKQVEFARTIHSAGSDLLQLINDILDLSKIEAGRMDVRRVPLPLTQLVDYVEATFRPITVDKNLAFAVRVAPDAPEVIETDELRLQQVLRNLVSNAVKFTEVGSVELRIEPVDPANFPDSPLGHAPGVLAFAVVDTGIGVPEDKLQLIFEAFQQADGTTSRHYGGTGLGLSISRELTNLLGGELRASSTVGVGSTFTLYLPLDGLAAPALQHRPGTAAAIGDGAEAAGRGGGVPADGAPDRPGGVLVVTENPAGDLVRTIERTLVDLAAVRSDVALAVADPAEGGEALNRRLRRTAPGCVVIDLGGAGGAGDGLADPAAAASAGFAALEALLADDRSLPVPTLVYAPRALGSGESQRLADYRGRTPLESAHSLEHLTQRLTLHLLTDNAVSPERLQQSVPGSRRTPYVFDGQKVLVIDDDVRNVFALSSALELSGLTVLHAENGKDGLEMLTQHDDVALVLMDIMMPGMDGYAAIQAIRRMSRFADLPVVAVTAKAMKGDREKSLAVGATEHVTKPVDVRQLLELVGSLLTAD
ncbi:MAG: HAMP domain-containing protein, partial [Mycobacteriales bacterium]